MLVVGFDCETTGLDTKNDRITEVGAVLWDTDRKAPINVLSSYMYDKSYPKLTPEITALTGITDDDLERYGDLPEVVLPELLHFFEKADYVMAHNGTNFDVPILLSNMEKYSVGFKKKPNWIDSSVDVPYPANITVRKLSYLATEHGFLNPFPHRALFDVLTMLKVASFYDIDEIVRLSKSPSITIRAVVDYDNRALASSRGYRWQPENKMWIKTVKECLMEAELAAPFKVITIQER